MVRGFSDRDYDIESTRLNSKLIMAFPDPKVLEELLPELSRLAHTSKTESNKINNFCQRMKTAARLWTIKQSLSNPNSDFFIEIESEEFKCADWEKLFFDKIPEAKNLTLADFLLAEYTSVYIQSWKKSIIKRYQIEAEVLDRLLSSKIFIVDSRTFRNHFKRLTEVKQPVLAKIESSQGKYKKVKLQKEVTDNYSLTNIWENTEEDILSFFNDGLSTIAELLLTKIKGQQRLFIHTDYVVTEELQDVAGDWADNLKENWHQLMYTAPLLTELLQQQHQRRNQSDLFRQGQFSIHWRAKVGSFPAPDIETIISAGEPCGAWSPKAGCPENRKRPEDKRNVGENYSYFPELPLYGYIPASGIRGLVRSWVLKQKDDELRQQMEQLLEVQQQDTITPGKIEFFDAYPEKPTKLSLDIVNPQEPFQVFHQGQSTPLSFYTLGNGDRSIRVKVAIRGISNRASEQDVDTVWKWVEQALTLYGVGSRTASGYGSLKPKNQVDLELPPRYKKKTFNFTLHSQGCGGVNARETTELRPTHWRGWLRSWALRFFLGVMSQDDAQRTVAELFGAIELPTEPRQIKGCVNLKIIKGKTWGEESEKEPDFYTWKGQIEISAPQDILDYILLPIIRFAASVGGVGRGWRRPLHIFVMRNGRATSRGTYLRLTYRVRDKNTNQLKNRLYCIPSITKPQQWQQIYQKWKDAIIEKWSDRYLANANRQTQAEVFAPHTCAVYAVPYPEQEPIDLQNYDWEFTKPLETRGEGMDLIYDPDYKRKREVGGSAAGRGNSHCSWVSIKRVKVPHPNIKNSKCQEIVCLFLGGTNPSSQTALRAKFLRDLHNIEGAIHLFGVSPN